MLRLRAPRHHHRLGVDPAKRPALTPPDEQIMRQWIELADDLDLYQSTG